MSGSLSFWVLVGAGALALVLMLVDLRLRWEAEYPGALRRFPMDGLSGMVLSLLTVGLWLQDKADFLLTSKTPLYGLQGCCESNHSAEASQR